MNSIFTFDNNFLDRKKGEAIFFYKLEKDTSVYSFTHKISFPPENVNWEKIPPNLLQNILTCLHLAFGISYWKTFCPEVIKTPKFQLTKSQAMFWNTIYTKGLGEFFYKNKINFLNLIKFPFVEKKQENPVSFLNHGKSLVFFGGGKDSIVTAELLKKNKKEFTLFMVGESQIQKETSSLVGKEEIIFKNTLDPLLFELNNSSDVYNGHIPITAVWSFVGLFAAVIYGFNYVISSNEQSSSYGNVKYLGVEINHQWSKSSEFENLFINYIKHNFTHDISYFSLLRSWNEITIMKFFINYPQYFPVFSSCNRNFGIQKRLENKKWCRECPKCIFVFTLMTAFLKKNEVIKIFGKNLYNAPLLLTTIKELLGVEKFKPFECVGTPEETQFALYQAYKKSDYNDTLVMRYFEKNILPILNLKELEEKIFHTQENNNVPVEFTNF